MNKEPKNVFIELSNNGVSMGKIVINLRFDVCPITCQNFLDLCKHKVVGEGFIGSPIHRIIPDFMMQGGDFTAGNGTGGHGFSKPKFNDENFILKHDKEGVLSMANSGPNTNGSQFFITFIKCDWLDNRHVVFGSVVEGMDVVKKVESYGTRSGKPTSEIVISSCGEL